MKIKLTKLSLIILSIVFAFNMLHAQEGRGKGRLAGVVLNEKGKPMHGVKVVLSFIKNPNVKQEKVSDKSGKWIFAGLGSGKWQVAAMADGYKPITKVIDIKQLSRNPEVKLQFAVNEAEALKKDALMVEEGNKLYKEGKYQEAIEKYKGFLAKRSDFYQLYHNIGNCYVAMKDYENAEKQFNLLIEKSTNDEAGKKLKAQAYSGIGNLYLSKGDMNKAQGYFKKSVDLDPTDAILAYNVAEIYYNNQKTKEAIDYYNKALQIKPKWYEMYTKIGYAYLNVGDMKNSIKYFKLYLEKDPNGKDAETIKEVIKSLK